MYIKVHVYPGMKKERVIRQAPHTYEIVLKVPAERNLANARVGEIVAELYAVPLTSIRLVTGHRSPSKIIEITQ
jgi:uncharacterized protein YggU (UPF0235/DUF167 family)